MDQLEEKHLDTKRGFHYRYYVSPSTLQFDSAKPVILLCHGWPDSAILWKDIIPYLLKAKLRLVVPDLLGYGGSSKPTHPTDFEIKAMVIDVVEILDAENISSPIIPFGHDWGAYFASRFYLLNTPRMAGVITLNVAFQLPRGDAFNLDQVNAFTEQHVGYPLFAYWEVFADPDGPALMDQHVESIWYAIHGDGDDWMKKLFCTRGAFKDWLSHDRTDVPLKPYARDETLKSTWIQQMKADGFTSPCCWYRATKENWNQETEKSLQAKLDTPYLFIGCDGDVVCRTDAIETVKQAGVATDLEVKELHSGHWSPFEVPDEVGPIVLEWLSRKGFSA